MKYPRISVVTPSFNQADFLERTIHSVLDQDYPNLEYIIIDGGSTDGSVDIIRKFEKRLAFWVSEPDAGQANAINKGLRLATGEWVAWQNSDDIFFPGAFSQLASAARKHPTADLIIGNMDLIDAHDQVLRDMKYVKPTYEALLAEGMVLTNQAAFWRRKIHSKLGFLDETLDCGFDFEWFLRVLSKYEGAHVNRTWGALRLHEATKTSNRQAVFDEEYRRIHAGRQIMGWRRRYYQMRRMALLIGQGNLQYVVRGLRRRATLK